MEELTKEYLISQGWELTDKIHVFYGKDRIFTRQEPEPEGQWMDREKISWELRLEPNNRLYVLKFTNGGFFGITDNKGRCIFDGMVENKNEFELLMKFLRIT